VRGRLWNDLEAEIIEEFESLSRSSRVVDSSSIVDDQIWYNAWAANELRRLPEALRGKIEQCNRRDGQLNYLASVAVPVEPVKKRRIHVPATPTRNQIYYQEKKRTRGMREKLEKERDGVSHHFTIIARDPNSDDKVYEVDGYIQTGMYPDGRLGEIFVKVGKQGEFNAMLGQWAISTSIALQYGAPAKELFEKFLGSRFEPAGATTNKDIPRCTSVLDYLARYLLLKYFNEGHVEVSSEPVVVRLPSAE
jgi:hypothetical protein